MAKDNAPAFKPSKSLIISIVLHIVFFALLLNTLSFESKKPPITVNLQQDPGTQKKIVKATLIDKRAADLAVQRQAAAEKLKRDKIIEEQMRAERQQLEAEQAKQAALELAKQQQAKLEAIKQAAEEKAKQAQLQKKQAASQQQQLRKEALEKQAKQQIAKQQADALAKQQAAKQAALKSQHDRMLAEQQALLETEVERYRAEFAAAIEENRILSSIFTGDMRCKLKILLLPDGSILSVKILESSGNPAYDEMSAGAVYKSAPFAMPEDQDLYAQLREIVLSFKNGE